MAKSFTAEAEPTGCGLPAVETVSIPGHHPEYMIIDERGIETDEYHGTFDEATANLLPGQSIVGRWISHSRWFKVDLG